MHLLVVAATDHTGRTITLLTAGLLGVALSLFVLTVWYWRHTSPRRQHGVADSAGAAAPTPTTSALRPDCAGTPAPPLAAPIACSEATADEPVPSPEVEAVVEPVPSLEAAPDEITVESAPAPPPENNDAVDGQHGLDSDQWALLTQAVFDRFIEGDKENEPKP